MVRVKQLVWCVCASVCLGNNFALNANIYWKVIVQKYCQDRTHTHSVPIVLFGLRNWSVNSQISTIIPLHFLICVPRLQCDGATFWRVTLSKRLFRVVYAWPLCASMMSFANRKYTKTYIICDATTGGPSYGHKKHAATMRRSSGVWFLRYATV